MFPLDQYVRYRHINFLYQATVKDVFRFTVSTEYSSAIFGTLKDADKVPAAVGIAKNTVGIVCTDGNRRHITVGIGGRRHRPYGRGAGFAVGIAIGRR
jgi:hypothetical protein